MITVKLFRGETEIRALAPAWRSLTAQLKLKRHFHHVEWYLALAHTLEQHNLTQLQCVTVFSDTDKLVAVFPCRVERVQIGPIPLNAIRLASDHIDAHTARDITIAPDLAETKFFQGFIRYMAEHDPIWDVIELAGIMEDSSAATALKHCPQLPIILTPGGVRGRIEFVSCSDGADPFARLSKGFKQNLRTAHHKLEPTQVTFEVARTPTDLARLLPEFLTVESSGWKGALGTSALTHSATNTFLGQLLHHFGPSGGCEIHVMRYADKPVATLFGITPDHIWYIFRIGYDETHHRASPGHLIIENLLKQNAMDKLFNVLTPYNATPWFNAWKPDRILQISNAYVFRPTSQGMELADRVASIMRGLTQSG